MSLKDGASSGDQVVAAYFLIFSKKKNKNFFQKTIIFDDSTGQFVNNNLMSEISLETGRSISRLNLSESYIASLSLTRRTHPHTSVRSRIRNAKLYRTKP
jgi:hypothetical protein